MTEVAVAAIVRSGTMTSSSRPIPHALSARNRAMVPLGAATQWRAPVYSRMERSNSRVCVNSVNHPPEAR